MSHRAMYHRRAFRHLLRLPCQVVRERDFKLIADQTIDLSTDGALVVQRASVLTGEPLIVSFWLHSERRWFDAEATVARVVHGRRPDDGCPAVGIVFHGAGARERRALFRALRSAPPSGAAHKRYVRRAINVC